MDKGLLGNAIRQARIDKGLSQEYLAEKIGVTPTHIKHIESGHRMPSVSILYSLVRELYISIDNVFFDESGNEQIKRIDILLKTCTEDQLKLIEDVILSIKKYTL